MAATLKNSSVYRVKTKQDNWRSEEEVLSYNIKKKLVEKYWMDDNINICKLTLWIPNSFIRIYNWVSILNLTKLLMLINN